MEGFALVLAIILFILGLIGTFLPVLPGATLIYGGMLLYGIMTGFKTLNLTFYILQAVVLIIIFFIDFIASSIGTKRFGGSSQAVFGAGIGMFLGLILFPPLGIIIGPFLGAVITELLRGVETDQAVRIGFGTLLGILSGTLIKILAEILMIVYFFMEIL
ncbi:MAG: DUF456 domain-containing protein [Tepidanaerobacteraceae bacterium]|nr:DUF456 domain-containing protein [Thermoanaerobacterales bacterium]